MEASLSVPELVAAALDTAKTPQDWISEVLAQMGGQDGRITQAEELRDATVALEAVAVDLFSAFEARMQHNFKRGPFSRKLKSLLLEEGYPDLADRLHQYYLAINVLKHGKGASYRELLEARRSFVVVKPADEAIADDMIPAAGLIDVTVAGFFEGLASTILEAYDFLESR
ncbi:hypothetical protein [Litoreibacter janthinus]|uniref:Uncharacterized protein n=1 Tax=Litoreibacter janthinus TaxID=670154 RepID=A0A1I6I040_9RHOB|nr:hypothetical protein [Litoreibacter janthinus]SFR60086.1 hypothetical protein SAMN04488002_3639 [Litoreibacter janthinus]